MCGISGVISREDNNLMQKMLNAEKIQIHRGPDSQGMVSNNINGWNIYLGNQRLAILDLTPSANQPMATEDGSLTITYNGEIYNYIELREELKSYGYIFKTSSDTEVILNAVKHWGMEMALNKFNGMWAFALLDKKNRKFYFSRDRMGMKPFYIYQVQTGLYFASEIKTILAMASSKMRLNYKTVCQYISQQLLDVSSDTMFEGIRKIDASYYYVMDLSIDSMVLERKRYWNLSEVDENPVQNEAVVAEEIRELLFDSVKLRIRSDVPVGLLFSGGIDSSAIAVAMQKLLGKGVDINLISMCSNDCRYDETKYINVVAKYMGVSVKKFEFNLDSVEDLIEYLKAISWYNDEPVGGLANVAHYFLMQKAKELGITVILSGQGADELFCGYKKYLGFYLHSMIRNKSLVSAAKTLWKYYKHGAVVNQFSLREAKRYLPGCLRPPEIDIRGGSLQQYSRTQMGLEKGDTFLERQLKDIELFSMPILLHFEDRSSMACSREIRVPFLDHRLIIKAVSIPDSMKIYDGWTKYILRKSIESFLPSEIVWRKVKQGFDTPEREWLKNGHMRESVMKYFADDESYIFKYDLINRKNLIRKYNKYCVQHFNAGTLSFRDVISPLALEIWLRAYSRYLT